MSLLRPRGQIIAGLYLSLPLPQKNPVKSRGEIKVFEKILSLTKTPFFFFEFRPVGRRYLWICFSCLPAFAPEAGQRRPQWEARAAGVMSADSEEATSRASEKKDDDENGVEVDGDRVGSSGPENGAEEGAESASAESATVGAEGATGSSESKESNGGNKGDGDNEDGKDDNDADDDSDDSGGDSDDSDSESSGDSSSSEEEDAATARARREAEAEAKKAAADSAAESKKAPPKKKGGLFGRLTGRGGVQESSSSSSEESEDEVDLFEVEAETIEECVEALKLIEQVDSDWDILLDAPSDWDSDDSENKPTAPILRSSCGTLSIETTQIREDVLRDLIESRQTLKDAQKVSYCPGNGRFLLKLFFP